MKLLPQAQRLVHEYENLQMEADVPAYRKIGFVMRDKQAASLAVKRFMEYLDYRDEISRI